MPESHERYEQEIARWRIFFADKSDEVEKEDDELALIAKRTAVKILREYCSKFDVMPRNNLGHW